VEIVQVPLNKLTAEKYWVNDNAPDHSCVGWVHVASHKKTAYANIYV
jgi:hypothetical protein